MNNRVGSVKKVLKPTPKYRISGCGIPYYSALRKIRLVNVCRECVGGGLLFL
jgi:hypothetical protein